MIRISLILVLLVGICFTRVFAGVETYTNRLEGTQIIANGSSYTTYDDRYYEMLGNINWPSDFTNYRVQNKVVLGLTSEYNLSSNISGTVAVTIEYKTWTGGMFVTNTINRTLSVNYDINGVAQIDNLSSAVFEGGHFVKVSIGNITGGIPVSRLFVETFIEVERYYAFDGLAPQNGLIQPAVSMNEYLDFGWDYKKGAEFYELEYVHINDYTLFSQDYISASDLPYNFYLNSTRVTLTGTSYRIPKIFDHGYVIFRVRAVGMTGSDFTIRDEGKWTEAESGFVSDLASNYVLGINQEYDAGMNWSHQVGFSEDGKRIEGVSFSDGLGMGRQSVGWNPVTEQVVVSNVYYDDLGRPVVSDLPTPVDNDSIHHFVGFNKADISGNPYYQKAYFDPTTIDSCAYYSQGFSTTSGAGKYYSDQNPDLDGVNANIPDAEHFPFTRITYLNDFTGRVDKISSAGDTLAMGRGHETRMIYPSSNQTELNALFGVEVGDFSHYQKLITVDANGQVYVEYSDMAGRTIATYLEGDSPETLQELDGLTIITNDVVMLALGGAQDIDLSVPSSELTYQQFIAKAASYTFTYDFTPEQYTSVCLAEGICLDCVYDLEIRVKDECGTEYKQVLEAINGEDLDAVCNGSFSPETFILTLPEGLYTISKKLSVNQAALQTYWCYYIEDNLCTESVHNLFNVLYNAETFEDCTTEMEFEDQADGTCEDIRQIMLEDMMPGGQYGSYLNTNGSYSSTNDWSVYNLSTVLSGNWKNPVAPYYLDENNVDVTLFVTSQGSTEGEKLAYFITHFREEWAEALLPFHPEYCYLEFCESAGSSYDYDNQMMSTYEFDLALTEGYFKPLGVIVPSSLESTGQPFNGAATSTDPFYALVPTSYTTSMNNTMAQYITLTDPTTSNPVTLSMWEYAIYLSMNCGSSVSIPSCIGAFRDAECERDLVWVTFRGLYLQAKAELMFSAREDYAVANGCSNACIGAETPCSGNAAALAEYNPRWGNSNQATTLISNMGTYSGAMSVLTVGVADACQSSCEAYADEWLIQLTGCDLATQLNSTQLANLRADLIAVCMEGCDYEHPTGSSTTPPGNPTPNGHETIGDVLADYLGTNYESMVCSELLISYPGPYQSTEDLQGLVVQPLDTCGCNLLFEARADYEEAVINESLPEGVTNIETWMVQTMQFEIDDVDALLCTCDKFYNTINDEWITNANSLLQELNYSIPANMSCNASAECQGCEQVQLDIDILSERFGFGTFAEFSLEHNYETLLTNYLNSIYSFALSTSDYVNFINGCNATEEEPYCSVNPLMEEWTQMMTLLAMRGQLVTPTAIDLETQNIVYAYGELKEEGLGNLYSTGITGTTLTATFAVGTISDCNSTLTLPSGADFNFSDIVSFGTIYPLTMGCAQPNTTFEVEVQYYSCGVLTTGILSGSSDCMEVNLCVCGNNGQLLCYDPFAIAADICYQPVLDEMMQTAMEQYELGIEEQYALFVEQYNAKCSEAFATESFTLEGPFKRYQYTLFYYDQAGNLARTVAPLGVNTLAGIYNDDINTARSTTVSSTSYQPVTPGTTIPEHTYETKYKYNSYNQLVATSNPDQEGETKFWYDRYGRIAASQNPVQADVDMYSYSFYDPQGRPVQVGQVVKTIDPTEADLKEDDLGTAFRAWVNGGTKTEVTVTTYDKELSSAISAKFATGVQQNLRLRVATVAYFAAVNTGTDYQVDYTSAIHYSYDLHGNVIEQLQDVPMMDVVKQDLKSTQYEFELISGNVKEVHYQKDQPDQITHHYEYDKLNRLTEVFTTIDGGIHNSRQAHYFYYDYGPLARVELGQHKVQGMDYTYTINGWIKGMNSSLLNNSYDMGRDGTTGYLTSNGDVHKNMAADVAAYSLGYFNGDYLAIETSSQFEASYYSDPTHSAFDLAAENLYNGNIRSLVTSIYNMATMGTAYHYDQLNRLKSMTAFEYSGSPATTNDWFSSSSTTDYFNSYSYDKNGNITNLQRNGLASVNTNMDQFTYNYLTIGTEPSNRLGNVDDNTGYTSNYTEDIDDQNDNNYHYDKLGQLTADVAEGQTLEWRFGNKKLKKITKSTEEITFMYNPFGQRIMKTVTPTIGDVKNTFYSYDANGQVMAVYDVEFASDGKATLNEQNLYGASRLGMIKPYRLLFDNGVVNYPSLDVNQNTLGQTYYEITNYLGNVNAVITDRKTYTSSGPSTFLAVVISTSDYYPFGMQMPGRFTTGDYRFGYNGMEFDTEVKGGENSYTTEFRQFDPRLGRWLSLDPLMHQFPWMSPYVAFNNNPIYFIDPFGLEGETPDEPEVGFDCHDENGNHLKYDGNGEWSDFVTELNAVTVKATKDFTLNSARPIFYHDHGHCQDYPEIGYSYYGQRKPTSAEKRSERWWNTKRFGATLIRWDLGNALPAYKHFQAATGTAYEIDFEDYFDDDESATILMDNAVAIAKKSAEKLAITDGTIEMTSKGYSAGDGKDFRFPYPETEDWQKAIGAFNFFMTAKVTANQINGKITYTMELTIHAEDRYNFNPGAADIATGTPDGANGVFEITGLGKEFMQYGVYTTTITWTK